MMRIPYATTTNGDMVIRVTSATTGPIVTECHIERIGHRQFRATKAGLTEVGHGPTRMKAFISLGLAVMANRTATTSDGCGRPAGDGEEA